LDSVASAVGMLAVTHTECRHLSCVGATAVLNIKIAFPWDLW